MRCVLLIMAWITMCVGCADSKSISVVGNVKFDGKPVENATVMFMADSGGRPYVSTTDNQGHYALTFPTGGGAATGLYRVAVTAVENSGSASAPSQEPKDELMAELRAPVKVKTRWRTPKKYSSIKTSDLTAELTAGVENVANLDLK